MNLVDGGQSERAPRSLPISVSLFLIISALNVSGCGPSKITTKASSELAKHGIQTIALLPFETLSAPQVIERRFPTLHAPQGAKASDISVGVPPPNTEHLSRPTTVVPLSAAETVTQIIWSRLQGRQGVQIISPTEASQVMKKVAAAQEGELSSEATAGKVAERLSADAALVGKVSVYQERVGSRWGANPPAAVGFEMKLVSRDGTVLWVGNYYEQQRPMTEDLIGFIERKGGFVTADELAAYGAEKLVKEFPVGTASESD